MLHLHFEGTYIYHKCICFVLNETYSTLSKGKKPINSGMGPCMVLLCKSLQFVKCLISKKLLVDDHRAIKQALFILHNFKCIHWSKIRKEPMKIVAIKIPMFRIKNITELVEFFFNMWFPIIDWKKCNKLTMLLHEV